MWPWSKKPQQASPQHELRETFFGDMPLSTFAGRSKGEPWLTFASVSEFLGQGNQAAAVQGLRSILDRPQLEARHYLQAWDQLRKLGVQPPADEQKHVLGVVVDVPMKAGFDTLAAYEDHGARYINYSGKVVIWEAPDTRLNAKIDALLQQGERLARMIGPWEGPRPPLAQGQARLSLLTPSGLHFGQAPLAALSRDEMAMPLLAAATTLMQALVELTEQKHSAV
jgi:hypothetical protein